MAKVGKDGSSAGDIALNRRISSNQFRMSKESRIFDLEERLLILPFELFVQLNPCQKQKWEITLQDN